MSETNITIQAGSKKRLLTGGKYCPANILITADGGGDVNSYYTDAILNTARLERAVLWSNTQIGAIKIDETKLGG